MDSGRWYLGGRPLVFFGRGIALPISSWQVWPDRDQNSSHSNFLTVLKNSSYCACAKTLPRGSMPMWAP